MDRHRAMVVICGGVGDVVLLGGSSVNAMVFGQGPGRPMMSVAFPAVSITESCLRAPSPTPSQECLHQPGQYRFAFGALRADRWWWWVLRQLLLGFLASLAEAVSTEARSQLYL